MAHAFDHEQAGAGDGARGGAASRGSHELVGGAVDDESGGGDVAQLGGAVPGGEDGRELAGDGPGIVAAVVHGAEQGAQVFVGAVEAG